MLGEEEKEEEEKIGKEKKERGLNTEIRARSEQVESRFTYSNDLDPESGGPPAGCGIESASRQRKGNLREKRGVRGKRQKEVEKKEEEEDEEEDEEEEEEEMVMLLVAVAMAMVVVVLLLLKEERSRGVADLPRSIILLILFLTFYR
uniref:Uncharacterized protein n=1 Tax=Vespula pensylvanica TaxID=30213 RepID=A0A834U8K7_VESPE|nr:hypothetical protein H0235_009502 [Vespula pensylvanica]